MNTHLAYLTTKFCTSTCEWGIPDSEEVTTNNNNTKSFGFSGFNQIILKTKNRFVEELRGCCNVENERLCPPDRGEASILRECQGFFPES